VGPEFTPQYHKKKKKKKKKEKENSEHRAKIFIKNIKLA
jgi:hypothetical protein